MGRFGPAPTSTDELKKRGSTHAKLRKNEIQVPILNKCPSPPSWLTDKGSEVWNEHAPAAFAQGVLTELDVMTFALMCERLAEYIYYRGLIDSLGTVVEKENYTGAHPCVKMCDETSKSVLGFARECGLTVVSRIGLPKPQAVLPKAGEIVQSQSLFAKG